MADHSTPDPPGTQTSAASPSKEPAGAGLCRSGWFPALLAGATLCAAALLGDGPLVVIPAATLLAIGSATLFSLAVGPWLGPWRRAKTTAGFALGSALLALGLLLWSLLSMAAVPILGPSLIGLSRDANHPLSEIVPGLDAVINAVPGPSLLLAWGLAMLCCLAGREHCQKLPYSGESAWRKLLSLLVLAPYLYLCARAGAVAWNGRRLDPDFMAAYGSDIRAALQERSQTPATARPVPANLPRSFRSDPAVRAWLERAPERSEKAAPATDWNAILRAWCREAASRWAKPRFWQDPELLALARLASQSSFIELSGVDPALRAEAAIRTQVLLLDHGGVTVTQSQRLYDMSLSAQQWERLLRMVLARDDLEKGAALSEDILRERFVAAGARLLQKRPYDLDGNPQRDIFQRCLDRSRLNDRWRHFQQGKPYPVPAAPLPPQEFEKRYAPSLSFDLDEVDEDPRQATFDNALARQDLAYNAVLMELQRLRAAGAPLPRRWSDLAAPVAALARAYAPWMELRPIPGGVRLIRKDPRHGLGLPHDFREAGV
jgi:hypothetical protein